MIPGRDPDYEKLSLENLHQLRRLCDRGNVARLEAIDAAINAKLGRAGSRGRQAGESGEVRGARGPYKNPEKTIVTPACDGLLEALGFAITKFDQPRITMQTPGIPDRYVQHTRHRWRAWIEYKYGNNDLTPKQVEWHRIEREAGGIVFTVWDATDLAAKLLEHGFPGSIAGIKPT